MTVSCSVTPSLTFTKMHGLGNDFVMVTEDALAPWYNRGMTVNQLAAALCNRHFGVGADGLIVATPADDPRHSGKFVYLNSDGTVAEMCGNGIRCYAAYLKQLGWVGSDTLTVESLAGVKTLKFNADGQITVDMGPPTLPASAIPATSPEWPEKSAVITAPLDVAGHQASFTLVNMGNPHAVTFDTTLDRLAVGPAVEIHPFFPQKTNVEFAHLNADNSITLHVWERACGWTQACGTGACATVVAALLSGQLAPTASPVAVHLPGGTLHIRWAATADTLAAVTAGDVSCLPAVEMTGPATRAFDGALPSAIVDDLVARFAPQHPCVVA